MSATERPIPFTDDMVRAVLAGRKTQTRRVLDGVKVSTPRLDGKRWTDVPMGVVASPPEVTEP